MYDGSSVDIQHSFDGAKGKFFISSDQGMLAEMTYVMSTPQLMIIDHTEVSPTLKGQGVGARLVKAGVDHARANGVRIIPLCPFAKKEFERHPEYAEVAIP